MNVPPLILSVAQQAALRMAFVRPKRSIGGFVAYVTIREEHDDQLMITEHPLEKGAVIADHAYKQPASLTLECGWSNSPQATGLTLTGARAAMSVQEVYARLLKLQTETTLIDVLTGKRAYKNMLIQGLRAYTDVRTEEALLVTLQLRQLLFASTASLTLLSSDTEGFTQFPGQTNATMNAGTKQLAPAPLYNPQAGP